MTNLASASARCQGWPYSPIDTGPCQFYHTGARQDRGTQGIAFPGSELIKSKCSKGAARKLHVNEIAAKGATRRPEQWSRTRMPFPSGRGAASASRKYGSRCSGRASTSSLPWCRALPPLRAPLATTILLAAGIIVYATCESLRMSGREVPVISRVTALAARRRDAGKFVLGPITLGLGAMLALMLYPGTGRLRGDLRPGFWRRALQPGGQAFWHDPPSLDGRQIPGREPHLLYRGFHLGLCAERKGPALGSGGPYNHGHGSLPPQGPRQHRPAHCRGRGRRPLPIDARRNRIPDVPIARGNRRGASTREAMSRP